MLTRDLLLYRIRDGVMRPTFIKPAQASWLELASGLLDDLAHLEGQTREEVEEVLLCRANASPRPRVAKGLVKLLLDRLEFEEEDASVSARRMEVLHRAARLLRSAPPATTLLEYEAQLAAVLPAPLDAIRQTLYADLPGRRRLLAGAPGSARGLLERYNLAQAQGPLLRAERLTVRALAPELLRVRKLLRWLKFCRLVAEVRRVGEDWTLEVEGPAAMLALQKKYGLQLASFLTAVPVLQHWELEAHVRLSRTTSLLRLSHEDPLVSPHPTALGHVPPEVSSLAERFEEGAWQVDLTPTPRHVGAAGACVPDLLFRHRETGREFALELFHPWHARALTRRLEELRTRPDASLLLGVDRALLAHSDASALEANPRILLFHGFPSPRRVAAVLNAQCPDLRSP